jgi:hypothetical protein
VTKNASAVTQADECIMARLNLRNNILNSMKCFSYNSQMCAYLRNITAGLITNKTIGSTVYMVGRSLTGTVPGQGTTTYRELLRNAIENAPYLFHNSYRAQQADDFYVLRTILYNTVVFTVLANLLVHYFDEFSAKSWTYRLVTRLVIFTISTFAGMIMFLLGNMGSAQTVLVGVWLPALLILVYFEAFLDHTIVRPW